MIFADAPISPDQWPLLSNPPVTSDELRLWVARLLRSVTGLFKFFWPSFLTVLLRCDRNLRDDQSYHLGLGLLSFTWAHYFCPVTGCEGDLDAVDSAFSDGSPFFLADFALPLCFWKGSTKPAHTKWAVVSPASSPSSSPRVNLIFFSTAGRLQWVKTAKP